MGRGEDEANWGFATKLIHSGFSGDRETGATTVPIYETASFAYDSALDLAAVFEGKRFGYIYSRIANPTVAAFERRINSLENGVGAIAAASGMAAIATVFFALTGAGSEVLASKSLFGGTYGFFREVLTKFGVRVRYVDFTNPNEYRKAFTPATRVVYLEALGNPKLDVPDIGEIKRLAELNNVPLVVDSTLTTPYLFPAKKYGVDIVIHSSTKYITGNGSSIGGVLVDLGNFTWNACQNDEIREMAKKAGEFAFLAKARSILQNTGACLSPFNAFLQFSGVETLGLRMERHCSNALELARYLSGHPRILEVNYPGLPNNPFHEIARRQFGGRYGALLTFKLGTRERCFQFIDGLRMIKNLANIGDTRTLVIHPASTIYSGCTEEERLAAGVTEDLIRVSVGIEDVKDIISDMERALGGLS
mgnify:CR=1 FL=1